MHYEGPRRRGRFLKHGSKVMDKVSLLDFSFEEICETKALDLDNAKRTIVHAQYHEPKALEETVRPPEIGRAHV